MRACVGGLGKRVLCDTVALLLHGNQKPARLHQSALLPLIVPALKREREPVVLVQVRPRKLFVGRLLHLEERALLVELHRHQHCTDAAAVVHQGACQRCLAGLLLRALWLGGHCQSTSIWSSRNSACLE